MISTVFAHLRAQWAGFLALFLVLAGGAAYAANTVFSADIVDGEVKSVDIGTSQVRSADVGTGQVQSVDVKDDGLTGGDIRERTLSGLDAADGFSGVCDPQNTTFRVCTSATITLERQMSVLIIATTHYNVFGDTAPAFGNCRLERNQVAISNDHPIGEIGPTEDTSRGTLNVQQAGMNLVDVETLAPGTYTFDISCNEVDDDIEYANQRIAAVKLAPG